MPRQSARSACPLMIVPKDRTMTRGTWRYMWRMCRIIWRDNHKNMDEAIADSVVYGTGFFTPDLSGLF